MDSKKRAGRAKSATTSVENQALRDTINASHFQLMKCQEELKHTKDQLRCLIHLIKRAWSGDIEASVHVANIVGIAPPDLQLRGDTNEIVAVPKSASVNNWASLTIGLLNREYSKEEKERKVNQLEYLLERERFLDSQLNGFIQQPDMRATKDVASSIRSETLKGLKSDQDLREKSFMELQLEIREQKSKLANKQKSFRSQNYSRIRQIEDQRTTDEDQFEGYGLYVDASQSQLAQKKLNSDADKYEKTAQAKLNKPEISNVKSVPSVTKRPPRPKTSKPFEKKDLKVQVTRKKPRPFSAKDPVTTTTSNKIMNNSRRKSLEGSFPREEYKLDQIERELKKTTSELQKKLNINPSGYLKF